MVGDITFENILPIFISQMLACLHSAVNKVSFIHKALRYNMIISEDHILREELNNVTRTLLLRAYPLHHIIKNIKKSYIYTRSNILYQRTPHTEKNILLIIIPFSDIGKSFMATIHKNWHTIDDDTTFSVVGLSKPLCAYSKSSSIHNHLVHSAQTYG